LALATLLMASTATAQHFDGSWQDHNGRVTTWSADGGRVDLAHWRGSGTAAGLGAVTVIADTAGSAITVQVLRNGQVVKRAQVHVAAVGRKLDSEHAARSDVHRPPRHEFHRGLSGIRPGP
jgi:hypothetical protein